MFNVKKISRIATLQKLFKSLNCLLFFILTLISNLTIYIEKDRIIWLRFFNFIYYLIGRKIQVL